MVDMERHARHLVLPNVGYEGQKKLAAARVLVIGAGGLGVLFFFISLQRASVRSVLSMMMWLMFQTFNGKSSTELKM